jgi:microsomal dipeptidase-like Zn-dependent dipeptidase
MCLFGNIISFRDNNIWMSHSNILCLQMCQRNLHHQKAWNLNKKRVHIAFIMSMEELQVLVLEKSM